MPLALNGTRITDGIAIGKARLLRDGIGDIQQQQLDPNDVDNEIRRYLAAVELAVSQLHAIRANIPKHIPQDVATFIDTYLLMLDDDALKSGPAHHISTLQCNAEWALHLQGSAIEAVFQEMQDPYLKTRIDDIRHVINRIQRILSIREEPGEPERFWPRHAIIVADDLSPADTLQFIHEQVAGLILQGSSPTSHTAILVRSLGIPTVVGVHNAMLLLEQETLVIDGYKGVVLAGLDATGLTYYRQLEKQQRHAAKTLRREALRPSKSLDGLSVTLRANLELASDLKLARVMGAAGVGLYRTEFLYLGGDTADESQQLRAYRRIVKAMPRQPVTIRTLDVGADKSTEPTSAAGNALGLRAIRLSLKEPAAFKVQLRAILRAAVYGQARILLPMVTTVSEIVETRHLLQECSLELKRKGIKHKRRLPLGCMIETPAAALIAAQLAPEVDFFSLGTNDLIQYTLAVDRTETAVNYLYDSCHPAVLGLLDHTLKIASRFGKPVSLCGEMAGDPFFTRFLLAIGLREFSLHPGKLPEINKIVRHSNIRQLQRKTARILAASSPQEARALITKLNSG